MIVLVLNYNDYESTEQLVESIVDYNAVERIVIVDNHSTNDSYIRLKKLEDEKVEVICSDKNLGYGGGNNLGIRYIYRKYKPKRILLCNPDVIIEESVIIELDLFLSYHSEYGIAAPFMLNRNGERATNTAIRVPSKWEYIFSIGLLTAKLIKPLYYPDITKSKEKYITVGGVAGSLFMMDTEKMVAYGMYDEKMFLYCEETVLSLKFQKAKIKTALLPNLTFIHNHSVSINKSYSKPIQKHKLLLNSKLYVIKHYYSADKLEYTIATVLKWISLLELSVWSAMQSNKQR